VYAFLQIAVNQAIFETIDDGTEFKSIKIFFNNAKRVFKTVAHFAIALLTATIRRGLVTGAEAVPETVCIEIR
jgi:hypothetical protein